MGRQTRRDFIQDVGFAGLGFWVAGGVSVAESKSPNEKINIACIGVGGKGGSDTDQAGNHGNVVAICDVDDGILNAKANKFPKAKKYNDFRKMLDEMGKEIDAVTVSTPDHTHAPAAVMAMKMKKHVYCQKPLTHTVKEARVMREVANQMGVVTQMGNQGTAENGLREAVEIIQSGAIGQVKEFHVWTNRPVWPQAPEIMARPEGSDPIPSHVHWDLFLGPAPLRPYKKDVYHTFKWRGWWDFGTGALGDMACHTANMAFMALKLGYPTSVIAEAGDLNPETFPSWARVKWEFPEREGMRPVTMYWYEGKKDKKKMLPPEELTKGLKLPSSGSLLVGEKGMMYSPNDYGAAFELLPKENFADYKKPEPRLARNGGGDDGMKKEWVAGIKGGPKPFSNFDYAGMMTEAVLLGNVAIKAIGRKLEWDGPNMKVTNDTAANDYLHYDYRSGWTL